MNVIIAEVIDNYLHIETSKWDAIQSLSQDDCQVMTQLYWHIGVKIDNKDIVKAFLEYKDILICGVW